MKDYEYEEENLDDFMINASKILSEPNNPQKNTIIESLKQHLSSIFHIQNEMENFFKTLNRVIFTSKSSKNNSQKVGNIQPFILYPLIFSFNPRTSSYFLDYYLSSLQQSISEDNRDDFTFLSEIFADVVSAIFSDEKNNKHLIRKNYLLEQSKKKNIYEKFLNFCNSNIKTNKNLEQSFGCLMLTEFIEKCPLIKEDKNLDNLFKIISDYLDDRWFECKLDLLNCTISLILSAENKFKPYAKICLFRILDYLTDTDWMIRKLSINIVYTLVFYCKDEIMSVKENIFEFLNALKEDPNEEVREVCMHTLEFFGEDEDENGSEGLEITEKKKDNNKYNKYRNKLINQRNKLNKYKELGQNGVSQSIRSASNRAQNNKNKEDSDNNNEENLRQNLQKEQEILDKIEKDFMGKNNNSSSNNYNTGNKSKNNTITKNSANHSHNKSKHNLNKSKPFENGSRELMKSTINSILVQLKKIQEDQEEFRELLTNLKQTTGNNYLKLSERLRTLEKKTASKYQKSMQFNQSNQNNNYIEEYREAKSQRDFREKKKIRPKIFLTNSDEKLKIEEIKKKFNDGRYNEAIIETNQYDKYLLKLLPLMNRKNIPEIEIAILEDVISRLNKRLNILCMEGDRESINDVLQFYIQIIKSKLELKLVTQLNIRNTLSFLKEKGINKLTDEDISNIERLLGSLRV